MRTIEKSGYDQVILGSGQEVLFAKKLEVISTKA